MLWCFSDLTKNEHPTGRNGSTIPAVRLTPHSHRKEGGFSLVEITVAAALIGLIAAAGIATLLVLNRNAVSTRIMTNAREIVQRNIEAAMGAPFSVGNVPTILTMPANKVIWDDDGGGDNLETIYTSRDGADKVTGQLYRTVVAESNKPSADIRRVTFRLEYTFRGRPLAYEMTSIRALDR